MPIPTKNRFIRVDAKSLETAQQAERPPLHIRWWILPLALGLCVTQAALNLIFESNPTEILLVTSQIPVMAWAFLMLLTLVINPLMRCWPVVAPFNRGEIMTLVAAMAVSALVSTGMVNGLIPQMATPFNPDWNTPQRKLTVDVIPYINKSLYITDPGEIVKWRTGIARMEAGFLDVLREIPWHVWIKPVCLWLTLFLALYLMYYSLTLLFFDSWSRREKLIFPLARIPEAVLSDEGAEEGSYSSMYKSALFWIGFGAVLALISYNGACEAGWLSDLQPLSYGIRQNQLRAMLENSIFDGIAEPWAPYGLTIAISFLTIGIAFLLPLEISLSLWSYYVVALFMLMVAIWTAAGATVASFYSNPTSENNFVAALGSGGLLAFAAIYLVKIAWGRWPEREGGAGPVAMLWSVVRWDGLLFLISLAGAAAWYVWSGVTPVWAVGYLAIEVLITIALMRIVAEGGLYWVQMHLSPFHIAKMIGGVQVIGAADLSRLAMYHSATVTQPKTILAPAVLNAFKMQEEGRASRRRFHLAVVLSILVTMVASVVFVLYLSYRIGGNRMNNWFFTESPQQTIEWSQRLASGAVSAMTAKGELYWLCYLIGGGWVALSMVMRRRFFWWLHPIGFVMISGRPMRGLWFSFFLGWLCKSVVVHYGGRHTFAKLRPLFLGFIFAEILGALGWGILSQTLGLEHVGIDFFNRLEI